MHPESCVAQVVCEAATDESDTLLVTMQNKFSRSVLSFLMRRAI